MIPLRFPGATERAKRDWRGRNRAETPSKASEPKDFSKHVLDTRNVEITSFRQRSNDSLVLDTGLVIGSFDIEDPGHAVVDLTSAVLLQEAVSLIAMDGLFDLERAMRARTEDDRRSRQHRVSLDADVVRDARAVVAAPAAAQASS